MKTVLIATIHLYQKTISPDHGWFSGGVQRVCRFAPTCSDYTIEAIQTYGSVTGVWLGLKRIARCHPWHVGGHDPLPKKV